MVQEFPLPDKGSRELNSLNLNTFVNTYAKGSYFSLNGSLTTPPCSEGVRWTVVKEPVPMSKAQKNAMDAMWKNDRSFANGKGNNRVVQPLNDRVVLTNTFGGYRCVYCLGKMLSTGAALLAIAAL